MTNRRVASYIGFFQHAGVVAKALQRDKLARLCCYVSRPALPEKCLALMASGQIRYERKTPYRNGATHMIFESLGFIANWLRWYPSSEPVSLLPMGRFEMLENE